MAARTSRKPKVTEEPSPVIIAAALSALELQDRIAARAYEIYLSGNGTAGDDLNNWLLAELEVKAAFSNPAAENISTTPKRKRISTNQSTTINSSTRKPEPSSAPRSQKGKQASE